MSFPGMSSGRAARPASWRGLAPQALPSWSRILIATRRNIPVLCVIDQAFDLESRCSEVKQETEPETACFLMHCAI